MAHPGSVPFYDETLAGKLSRPQPKQPSPSTTVVPMNSPGFDIEKQSSIATSDVQKESTAPSSDLTTWDGPNDARHPLNWPESKKWKNVLSIASMTLLTPFASSMFAPAIGQVLEEMHTTNRDIGSFMVSVYLLGYAFGPLFIAPCSELLGRLPVYHVCTVLFILMNVACGLSVNVPMLVIFRFLTGLFGAGPLTIGPGSVADLFKQEERGKAMAVWTMPILLGPCLGPAVGAYLSRFLGWRWNFWFLIAVTGAVFILCLILQDETHPPTLLRKRIQRLQKDGKIPATRRASVIEPAQSPSRLFLTSIIRPTKMLFLSPIIFGLSLLTAVAYGTLYLLFTTVSEVFQTYYGIVDNVGLVFFGFGVGQFAGLIVFGSISDRLVKAMAARNKGDVNGKGAGEMKPEYRLPPMLPGGAMVPIGLLIYGWTVEYRVHWFVPIIGTFLIGFGMITIFTPVSSYLVDSFPVYAASAAAANTVFRSIGGGLLPLAGSRMYATLGQGWGNTLLAGISLGCMVMIVIAMKYGETLRTNPKYQLKL